MARLRGNQHTVLPSVRLGSRGTSVSALPALSGDWQGGTDDISNQEEEEGTVTRWMREVAFAHAERTAHSSENPARQEPATLCGENSDHSAAVPRRVLRNVHAPFPQALILCNRLCQTIKELIADPYGK